MRNDELFLYHATRREYLDSILSHGLLTSPLNHNFESMNCENKIFLALSDEAAKEYMKMAGIPAKDVVVLKIPYKALEETQFEYDWNNRCEFYEDIDSCVYTADIPPDYLYLCAGREEKQNLSDFYHTTLYSKVIDTFEYEVETNLTELQDEVRDKIIELIEEGLLSAEAEDDEEYIRKVTRMYSKNQDCFSLKKELLKSKYNEKNDKIFEKER